MLHVHTIYGYEGRLQVLMRNLITCPDLVCDPLTASTVIDNARPEVERGRPDSWKEKTKKNNEV